MRNVLLFDLGRVLEIHNLKSFCNCLKKEYSIDKNKNIISIYKKWEILRDTDKIDEHKFYKKFTNEINIKISQKKFYSKYYENVHECHDVLKFIEENLYKKYELFIFSNNSRINIRKFKEKINFEKYFKKCIYSFDLKIKKPDINFFIKGLKEINHNGKDCFFFDDQLKSKINSEKLGIKFIQYINLNKLKKDLKKYKLIS
jgi:HAD superfamily hydrolase (TIGR01509 family)